MKIMMIGWVVLATVVSVHAADWRELPDAIVPTSARVEGEGTPSTTNDLKDAMLVWLKERTYPIQVVGGDGVWTIKTASGKEFSNYREHASGLSGCAPFATGYPYLYFCENGGMSAPDGAAEPVILEAGEFAFHPANNDTDGKLLIEFTATRSGWYRVEGVFRATNTEWGQGANGVKVQVQANGVVAQRVNTTADNAWNALEADRWNWLPSGGTMTISIDRNGGYSCDATGFKLRLVRRGDPLAGKPYRRYDLTQAVNQQVANHREDYSACPLVGGFYVDMGYRLNAAAEHTRFDTRNRDSDVLCGWKRNGSGHGMYPIIRFNLSGQEVLAANEIAAAAANEWALHPGDDVYNSLHFTVMQDFSANSVLVFKLRDLNNQPMKSSPGEAFIVRTNGVEIANFTMAKGTGIQYALPLNGLKTGDEIDFLMRSQLSGTINCDMTALAIELRKAIPRGLKIIFSGIDRQLKQ